jgi:glycyl-tRNA synthetase beta chain
MASGKKKTPARQAGKPSGAAPLLVELLTEELPPRALMRLMEAFSHGLTEALKEKNFLLPESLPQPYATPRRLAVVISHVLDKQSDRIVERKGPAVATALGADGQPARHCLDSLNPVVSK